MQKVTDCLYRAFLLLRRCQKSLAMHNSFWEKNHMNGKSLIETFGSLFWTILFKLKIKLSYFQLFT